VRQAGSRGEQLYLLTGTQVISVNLALMNGSRYLSVVVSMSVNMQSRVSDLLISRTVTYLPF